MKRADIPEQIRFKGTLASLMANLPKVFRLKYFTICVLMYAFCCGVLFSYISSAAFIIQSYYGFSELMFSLFFAVNALGIGIGSGLSLKFKKMSSAALFGTIGITVAGILQFCAYHLFDTFVIYEGLTFLMLVAIGFILTSSTAIAMDEGREMVGTASAVFGATGFLFGGIVTPLVSIGNIMTTTILIIILCSVCSLAFAVLCFRRR